MKEREEHKTYVHSEGEGSAPISPVQIEQELAMFDELAQELGQSWSLEETPLEVLERLREESANRGAASSHQRSP